MPKRTDIKKILIIGSGPIIIGQACEFDYSGTQACKALRSMGYEIVLVNSNPATIMTDTDMADVTYIEPLIVSRLTEIIAKERPDALLPNLGGQSGLNLSLELAKAGVLDKYGVEQVVEIAGNATGLRGLEKGILPAAGAYGLTPNVDAELWEAVKAKYQHMAIFRNGLIFAVGDNRSAKSEAKNRASLRHGAEPIEPKQTTTSEE